MSIDDFLPVNPWNPIQEDIPCTIVAAMCQSIMPLKAVETRRTGATDSNCLSSLLLTPLHGQGEANDGILLRQNTSPLLHQRSRSNSILKLEDSSGSSHSSCSLSPKAVRFASGTKDDPRIELVQFPSLRKDAGRKRFQADQGRDSAPILMPRPRPSNRSTIAN